MKKISLEQLRSWAGVLSNGCYVRWWAHYNYPQETPWIIAISAKNNSGKGISIEDLEKKGGELEIVDGNFIYKFERSDDFIERLQNELLKDQIELDECCNKALSDNLWDLIE